MGALALGEGLDQGGRRRGRSRPDRREHAAAGGWRSGAPVRCALRDEGDRRRDGRLARHARARGAALGPLRAAARRNCRAADAVTVVSDRYADLARSYGFSGPVRRFYHGIALPPAPKAGGDASAASALRLLYLGNLGRSYDLSTVVEALALLPGATLDVAGEGEQVPALEALAERAAPRRVRFHGYVGRAALADLLSTSDVGIVPMAPDSCVGIPYKFADYSSFGLAIVSSLGGESGRLLARYGAGAAYRGGDPQNLAASLRALAPKLAEARKGSRRLAETEFDADAIYAAYVRFATDLVK